MGIVWLGEVVLVCKIIWTYILYTTIEKIGNGKDISKDWWRYRLIDHRISIGRVRHFWVRNLVLYMTFLDNSK